MTTNYYHTLEVSQKATQTEIKGAYRRLVKRFHPDSQQATANHEQIIRINAAYEVLGDTQRRRVYDLTLFTGQTAQASARRQRRTAYAQNHYQHHRQTAQENEIRQSRWLQKVYRPISRIICCILNPLDTQIRYLAADPFDDQLLEDFSNYLGECRQNLNQARTILASQPNPAQFAGIAAHFYYCLNQVSDGIDELEWFTLNYDDRHLHTGKELFRIARSLYLEAQDIAKAVV